MKCFWNFFSRNLEKHWKLCLWNKKVQLFSLNSTLTQICLLIWKMKRRNLLLFVHIRRESGVDVRKNSNSVRTQQHIVENNIRNRAERKTNLFLFTRKSNNEMSFCFHSPSKLKPIFYLINSLWAFRLISCWFIVVAIAREELNELFPPLTKSIHPEFKMFKNQSIVKHENCVDWNLFCNFDDASHWTHCEGKLVHMKLKTYVCKLFCGWFVCSNHDKILPCKSHNDVRLCYADNPHKLRLIHDLISCIFSNWNDIASCVHCNYKLWNKKKK